MPLMKLGLERSIIEAMGRVALEFAALEDEMVFSIKVLLASSCSFKDGNDLQVVTDIFTAEMPFRTRVDVFGALCRYQVNKLPRPSDVDDLFKQTFLAKEKRNNSDKTNQHSALDDLLKRVTQAEESRNAVVHSAWKSTEEPGKVFRAKTKAKRFEGLVTSKQNLSLQEIRTTAKSIAKVREELFQFTISVFVSLSEGKLKVIEKQPEAT